MKLISRLAGLLVLASIAGTASAQDVIATVSNQWEGFYAGVNIGGAWNSTCNSWTLNNVTNPALVNAFNNRNCPNNGVFVGGVQIGYNFQYNEWVWGFGLDYDYWSSKNHNRSFVYTAPAGGTVPSGTFAFSGKTSPNGFAILGPRIGYAVDNWLPYFRVGGVFTGGSRTSSATYTQATNTTGTPDAAFSGSKNFKSNGFGLGLGSDFKVADQLFIRAEYTYVSLGKGTSSATACTPAGSALCTQFNSSQYQLDNIHNKFTASVFRVGLNYRFQ
jgi:outer membrane immunogenic protein